MGTNTQLHNPDFAQHGYIQVYTGNGKGKTTAALGLTLRALGHGWNVLIVMFTKDGSDCGELFSFSELSSDIKKRLKIITAGLNRIVYRDNITAEDKKVVQEGWNFVKKAIEDDTYQLIILDEINIAIDLGLVDLDEVIKFLKNKPQRTEIVLTGRNANQKIVDLAHLVSEINPVKHYWNIGVQAREGIEY